MAKPRVFISSTFYDLRQVRTDIDQFIVSLGYEPIRNEEGNIPYGKEHELQEYCYQEISNCDILVSIIGNRYGSASNESQYSITQKEIKTAIQEKKQVYIFIEQSVLNEYETYLLNKNNPDIKYKYVDNVMIYKFIEEVKSNKVNNNIKGFTSTQDITHYLREQFAGLFKTLLDSQTRLREANLIQQLETASSSLSQMIDIMSDKLESSGDKTDEVNRLLKITHPLVAVLKEKLAIPYNFYINGVSDLTALLKARSFKATEDSPWEDYYEWTKDNKDGTRRRVLRILKSLFDANDNLKFMMKTEWDDTMATLEEVAVPSTSDDLPF